MTDGGATRVARLNFFATVFAFKFSNHDLPWLVIPVFQDMRNVEVHRANMTACKHQVNAWEYVHRSFLK